MCGMLCVQVKNEQSIIIRTKDLRIVLTNSDEIALREWSVQLSKTLRDSKVTYCSLYLFTYLSLSVCIIFSSLFLKDSKVILFLSIHLPLLIFLSLNKNSAKALNLPLITPLNSLYLRSCWLDCAKQAKSTGPDKLKSTTTQ